MRTRVFWAVAVLSVLLTFGLGGCILGVNPDGNPPGSDTGADSTDGEADTTPQDTTEGEDGGEDVDAGPTGCTDKDDCTGGPPNTQGQCDTDTGTCHYDQCAEGYIDEDGDLMSNGCECDESDRGAYRLDSDGDGYPDGEDEDEDTPEPTRFCTPPAEGNWVSDRKDFDCRPNDPDANPGVPDGELWKCDGLNNDCDKVVDEVCCDLQRPTPQQPTPEEVNPEGTNQQGVSIVPAHPSVQSRSSAAFFVGWLEPPAQGTNTWELVFTHVDREGGTVGELEKYGVTGRPVGFALTRTASGYAAAYATRSPQSSIPKNASLKGLELTTGGEPMAGPVSIEHTTLGSASQATVFRSLDIAASGKKRSVISGTVRDRGTFQTDKVRAFVYETSSSSPTVEEVDINSVSSAFVPHRGKPVVVGASGWFFYAWWDADNDDLRLIAQDLSGPSPGSNPPLADNVEINKEPMSDWPASVDLAVVSAKRAGSSAELALVYPEFNGEGEGRLMLRRIKHRADSGLQVGGASEVVGFGEVEGASVAPVRPALDKPASRLALIWRGHRQNSDTVEAGVVSLGSSSLEAEFTLGSAMYLERLSVAHNGQTGAALWLNERPRDTLNTIHFAPLSREAKPVCAP